jgi:acetoin utilization deacetylase AcuC-like enzyme
MIFVTNRFIIITIVCWQHYTCPNPITRSGNHPPNENVGRLEVLLNEDYGTFCANEFSEGCLVVKEPQKVALSHILRVHDYHYVRKIQKLCESIPDDPRCVSHLDGDTAVSHRSYEAALRAAGSVVEAVDAVMKQSARNAFCAIRPPGHHGKILYLMRIFNHLVCVYLSVLIYVRSTMFN